METRGKLLDQMRQLLRLKHMSIRTEENYIHWVKRFILLHHKQYSGQNFGGHVINGTIDTKFFSSGMAEKLPLWHLEIGSAQIRMV